MITEVKVQTLKKLLHKWIDMQASWKAEDIDNLIAVWEEAIGPAQIKNREPGDSFKIKVDVDSLLQSGITLGYLIDTEDPFD